MSAHINKNVFPLWPRVIDSADFEQPKDQAEILRTKLKARDEHIRFLQNQITLSKKVRRNLRWVVGGCIVVIIVLAWHLCQGG